MKSTITPWGKCVKKTLIDRDMTLIDLAEKIGYSVTYLSSIINGKRVGCIDAEEKISEELNIKYPYSA